jgi:hypothetical protein
MVGWLRWLVGWLRWLVGGWVGWWVGCMLQLRGRCDQHSMLPCFDRPVTLPSENKARQVVVVVVVCVGFGEWSATRPCTRRSSRLQQRLLVNLNHYTLLTRVTQAQMLRQSSDY